VLEHVDRPDYVEALRQITVTTRPEFSVQSNLFNGRAGLLYFLTRLVTSPFAQDVDRECLDRHAHHLGSYAVVNKTGVHFPGEQIMRLSTDLASGSAGVLASLRAYGAVTFGATTAAERRVVPLLGIERLAVPSRPTTTVRTTTTGGR
jgi:hypothetical protein